MMNVCFFVGNLVKNPESKEVEANGNKYTLTSFTIAVNGKKDSDASFINCVAWNDTGKNIEHNFSKGDQILVTGALHNQAYKDKKNEWKLKSDLLVTKFLKLSGLENKLENKKEEKPEVPFDFPNGI